MSLAIRLEGGLCLLPGSINNNLVRIDQPTSTGYTYCYISQNARLNSGFQSRGSMLTPRQVALVQDSFETIYAVAETAAETFYNRLFELDPTIRPLFKNDFKKQCYKFIEMLHMIVLNLGRLDAVTTYTEPLGIRHIAYGANNSTYYLSVGQALIWMLEQRLGAEFTPELQAAWREVYNTLSGKMLEAAAR